MSPRVTFAHPNGAARGGGAVRVSQQHRRLVSNVSSSGLRFQPDGWRIHSSLIILFAAPLLGHLLSSTHTFRFVRIKALKAPETSSFHFCTRHHAKPPREGESSLQDLILVHRQTRSLFLRGPRITWLIATQNIDSLSLFCHSRIIPTDTRYPRTPVEMDRTWLVCDRDRRANN